MSVQVFLTLPLPSLSFPFLLLPRQIDEVFIRCRHSMLTVMCSLWAYTSAVPYVHVIRLKSKFPTTVKACYSVSSVYVEGQSLLFFSHVPEKLGYGTPTPKSGGTRMSQKLCLCVCLSAGYLGSLRMDFYEIFWMAGAWPEEELIRFWWRSGFFRGFLIILQDSSSLQDRTYRN